MNKEITNEQQKVLEGLLFWRREKRILDNLGKDTSQVERNISHQIDRCDKFKIPFSIQNAVLEADVHTDIIDVLKDHKVNVLRG